MKNPHTTTTPHPSAEYLVCAASELAMSQTEADAQQAWTHFSEALPDIRNPEGFRAALEILLERSRSEVLSMAAYDSKRHGMEDSALEEYLKALPKLNRSGWRDSFYISLYCALKDNPYGDRVLGLLHFDGTRFKLHLTTEHDRKDGNA